MAKLEVTFSKWGGINTESHPYTLIPKLPAYGEVEVENVTDDLENVYTKDGGISFEKRPGTELLLQEGTGPARALKSLALSPCPGYMSWHGIIFTTNEHLTIYEPRINAKHRLVDGTFTSGGPPFDAVSRQDSRSWVLTRQEAYLVGVRDNHFYQVTATGSSSESDSGYVFSRDQAYPDGLDWLPFPGIPKFGFNYSGYFFLINGSFAPNEAKGIYSNFDVPTTFTAGDDFLVSPSGPIEPICGVLKTENRAFLFKPSSIFVIVGRSNETFSLDLFKAGIGSAGARSWAVEGEFPIGITVSLAQSFYFDYSWDSGVAIVNPDNIAIISGGDVVRVGNNIVSLIRQGGRADFFSRTVDWGSVKGHLFAPNLNFETNQGEQILLFRARDNGSFWKWAGSERLEICDLEYHAGEMFIGAGTREAGLVCEASIKKFSPSVSTDKVRIKNSTTYETKEFESYMTSGWFSCGLVSAIESISVIGEQTSGAEAQVYVAIDGRDFTAGKKLDLSDSYSAQVPRGNDWQEGLYHKWKIQFSGDCVEGRISKVVVKMRTKHKEN